MGAIRGTVGWVCVGASLVWPTLAAADCRTALHVYWTRPGDGPPVEVPASAIPQSGILANSRVRVYDSRRLAREGRHTRPEPAGERPAHPNSRRFSFINVFFHADRTMRFFEGFGFQANKPVALAVDPTSSHWAVLVSGQNVVLIHPRSRPASKDSSVIAHELVHVVANHYLEENTRYRQLWEALGELNPKARLTRAQRARRRQLLQVVHAQTELDEGFADFFAFWITRTPVIAEGLMAQDGRPLERDIRIPPARIDSADPHSAGHLLAHRLFKLAAKLQSCGLARHEISGLMVAMHRELFSGEGFASARALGALMDSAVLEYCPDGYPNGN